MPGRTSPGTAVIRIFMSPSGAPGAGANNATAVPGEKLTPGGCDKGVPVRPILLTNEIR